MIRLLYSNNYDPSKNIRKRPDWAKYAPTKVLSIGKIRNISKFYLPIYLRCLMKA